MADAILLEDGTSLLLLEDGISSLLLEEAPPAPTPPATSYATWQAGIITVPGSTGTQAITGLGGTPAAVFLFGTNFSTEDSVVTSTGTGIFRGMAAPYYNAPTVIANNSAFVSAGGDQSRVTGGIVNSLTTAGTGSAVDVAASVISMDADGFTLSYSVVTSGRRFAYVALMDVVNYGAYGGSTAALSLGYKVGAALVHGGWKGPDYTSGNEAGIWYGGGAYPGTTASGWYAAGLSASGHPAHANQYIVNLNYIDPPQTRTTRGSHFIGPSLTADNITTAPTGTGLEDYTINTGVTNGGMFVFWDDEDSQTGSITPAQTTGGTATVSGLPFAPGLVLGYSISDEPNGSGTSSPVRGAIQLSVATTDFQWAAVVDNVDRGSYQSFQRGFADTVHNTDLHAGTIELTDDGFILTTAEDDTTVHDWVWHAFGHPKVGAWIPQIYRLLVTA